MSPKTNRSQRRAKPTPPDSHKRTTKVAHTGAPESNAGDDFHFVWAARRALQLIRPGTTLQLVKIEGVTPKDLALAQTIDPEDAFLGVDMTEYHGGTDFRTSSHIIVSQLKYSVWNADKPWTIARLLRSPGKKPPLIRTLADIYRGFSSSESPEVLHNKLRIQLVSNQPTVPELINLPSAVFKSSKERELLRRLETASGLSHVEFATFRKCLDFSACGADSRQIQHVRLIQELGRGIQHAGTAARGLIDLIASHARPEGRSNAGLSNKHILAAMDVGVSERLFPVPSLVKRPENPIPLRAAQDLATFLQSSGTPYIVAHGPAGIGKTTTLQLIADHLPAGSEVVIFDCYANGNYDQPNDQRHKQAQAFTQLTNELAVRGGFSLQLHIPIRVEEQADNFIRALRELSATLPPDALLVLAIDAADNAVTAARGDSDCIVPVLWRFKFLPANVRLLMSCRTHRQPDIMAPSNVRTFPLTGFDPTASARHLKQFFPDCSEEQAQRFHINSDGNPRSQFYHLREAVKGGQSIETVLDRVKTTPEAMFADLLTSACGVAPATNADLALLVSLNRPTPLAVLEILRGPELRRLAEGLVPGATIQDNAVSFRDEDFEHHLRHHIPASLQKEAEARLGLRMLQLAANDAFAARHVAHHLFLGDKHEELIALAIGKSDLLAIPDEWQRIQTAQTRVSLALRSAARLRRFDMMIRLICVAAELNKNRGALVAIIQGYPDLALRYSEPEQVRRILLPETETWQGPAHIHLAQLFARRSFHELAEHHRGMSDACIQRWRSASKKDRQRWEIDGAFLTRGAEAEYWMKGGKAMARWLGRWRPGHLVMECFAKCADSLVRYVPSTEIETQLRETWPPVWAKAIVIAAAWRARVRLSGELRQLVAGELVPYQRFLLRRFSGDTWRLVDLAESFAHARVKTTDFESFLRSIPVLRPRHELQGHEEIDRFRELLRQQALATALEGRELKVDDLYPPKILEDEKPKDETKEAQRRRSYDEVFGRVIGSFGWRARAICHPDDTQGLDDHVRGHVTSIEKREKSAWPRDDWYFPSNAKNFTDALLIGSKAPAALIEAYIGLAESEAPGTRIQLCEDTARACMSDTRAQALARTLLDEACDSWESARVPAPERWDGLLRCAVIVAPYHSEIGHGYFRRALSAAEKIDDDQIHCLKFASVLATDVAKTIPSADKPALAARLCSMVEAHTDLVSENTNLPWTTAIAAAGTLDMRSALRICSRWATRRHADYGDTLPAIIGVGIKHGTLSATEALALLHVAGAYPSPVEIGLQILDVIRLRGHQGREELSAIFSELAYWVRRDLPPANRGRAANALLEWTNLHSLQHLSGREELAALADFVKAHKLEEHSGSGYVTRPPYISKPTADCRTPSDSPEAILAQARVIMNDYYSHRAAVAHVRESSRALKPEARTVLLSHILFARDTGHQIGWFELGSALALMEDWSAHPDVSTWVASHLTQILSEALAHPALFDPEQDYLPRLQAVASRCHADFISALGEALAKHTPTLSPEKLFLLARPIWGETPTSDRATLLEHLLAQSETRLRAVDRTPEPQDDDPAISIEPHAVLGDFLFFLLGHPEQRVRWQALHAIRRLVRGDTSYLAVFSALLDRNHRAGFGAVEEPFYWMTARMYLHLFFLKSANEHPEHLVGFAPRFSQTANDNTFAHSLVKELSKRTCEILIQHSHSCLDIESQKTLTLVNAPRACAWPKGRKNTEPRFDIKQETRADHTTFSFDGMDTVPYWYEPLARVFGWSNTAVTNQARHWICERWHWHKNDVVAQSKRWRSHYRWQDTSNNHGSIPKVENLQTYLEFHAMHFVAGDWVERQPLAVDTWESDGHGWRRWTERWIERGSAYWPNDLLQPTPLAVFLWRIPSDSETWLKQRPPGDYDAPLGLVAGRPLPVELPVSTSIDFANYDENGSISISSTLVPSASARALLYALESDDNPFTHGMPCTSDEDATEESDEPGFTMQAWLRRTGLTCPWQEFDPLLRASKVQHNLLPDEFSRQHGLQRHGHTWHNANGHVQARVELWSDSDPARDEPSEFRSGGDRLWLKSDLLLTHLRSISMDLLFKVLLYRTVSSRYQTRNADDKKENPFSARYYLLRQDGTVEVMGNHRYAG